MVNPALPWFAAVVVPNPDTTDRLNVPVSPLGTVLRALTRVCLLLVMVQIAPKFVPSKLPEMVRLALLTET